MGRSQKQKGNRIERKIVKILQENGFEAKRTWGSSGRSMGLDDEVDIVLAPGPAAKDLCYPRSSSCARQRRTFSSNVFR